MKVAGQGLQKSRRKQVRSILVAGIVSMMALLVSPFGAASLGVMEAGDDISLAENTSFVSDTAFLENDTLDPEAESRTEGIVAEGISTEDVVASFLATPSSLETEVFLGMYTSASLQMTANEIGQVEAWLSANGINTQVAIAGTFMDIEFPNPDWNVPHDLDAAWDQGAVPFVNLAVGTAGLGPRSTQDVAEGLLDEAIRQWAGISSPAGRRVGQNEPSSPPCRK